MSDRSKNSSSGQWIADKIANHDYVIRTERISPNQVLAWRQHGDVIRIATLSLPKVTASDVLEVIAGDDVVDFVVNIPKDADIAANVYELAEQIGFGFGGYSDLLRALQHDSPKSYEQPDIAYFLRAVGQHRKVASVVRLDGRLFLIRVQDGRHLKVLVLNDYEFVAERIRSVRERYGLFDGILSSNPNCRSTAKCQGVLSELGIGIWDLRELFILLNTGET